MMNADLKLMDEVIAMIKAKDDSKSTVTRLFLQQIEFRLFLCLHIVRFELQTTGVISDLNAIALSQLFAFNVFECYFRDFPSVYDKCAKLSAALMNYNRRWNNHNLDGAIGNDEENWIIYFNTVIPDLIQSK
jgi:hypothetical protein